MAFHRHDLGGLMLQGVQPVHVADENLDRGGDQDHAHGHGEHLARALVGPLLHQVPGPDCADHEAGGQIGRQQHVGEAIGEGGIEDDLEPVGRYELADLVDGVALRRLHPAVHRQDPEGRGEGADRDHQGGHEVQLLADAVQAEQHDAQETRLQEEGAEHLIGHQGADDRSGLVGEDRPVGAELVGHDQT